LPTLTANDTVIFPFLHFDLANVPSLKLADEVKAKGSKLVLVGVGQSGSKELVKLGPLERFDVVVFVPSINCSNFFPEVACPAEFASKLIFNAISTGSCVQKGRVFGNSMINLGIRLAVPFNFLTFTQQQ
jgi:hypothetical protein